jgi:hypothetical protein
MSAYADISDEPKARLEVRRTSGQLRPRFAIKFGDNFTAYLSREQLKCLAEQAEPPAGSES